MAKKSSGRESFLKKKKSGRGASDTHAEPSETVAVKPAKLVWQMFQNDLLLTYHPTLLSEEIQKREIHKNSVAGGKREPFAFSFHRIRNAKLMPVQSVQSFVKTLQAEWPTISKARVFGTRWLKERVQENRCRLIQEGLNHAYAANATSDGEDLQVFLVRPDAAYVGVGPRLSESLHDVGVESPHLGGTFQVPESKKPPSRAYLKLTEALLFAGWEFKSGETVLDLAASPGGWTWVAAQQGAKVYAVDRAELTPELMAHPSVRFMKGDVFQFSPSTFPQWIICDVISDPDKSLELMKRFLVETAPEKIVWTLKFKKAVQFQILNLADEVLSEYSYLVRHLGANKNEVTVMVDTRKKRKA